MASLKLSLDFIVPVVTTLLIYSQDILGLLGPEYKQAWSMLDVLLIAQTLWLCVLCLNNLLYAYNKYFDVLKINMTAAIVQVVSLVLLIKQLGGLGAALSLLAGNIAAMIFAYSHYARQVQLHVNVKYTCTLALVAVVTLLCAICVRALCPHVVSALIPAALGYLLILKLRLVTREELVSLGSALLPGQIRKRLGPILLKLLDLVY